MENFDLEVSHESIISDTIEENGKKIREFIENHPDEKIIVTTKILSIVTMMRETTT